MGRADLIGTIDYNLSRFPHVDKPHLWAGIGAVVGSAANAYLSGYRMSEFRLRFNSWESEKIALREQGADMVQHFILGYGLTRYFLDNGSQPLAAGVSAFGYELFTGEIMESFPKAGGISWRDVMIDMVAVTVGVIDRNADSPIRFWMSSRTDVRVSAPNEFDPYHISLGVAVGRAYGLEIILNVQNWKDPLPTLKSQPERSAAATSYVVSNY